MDNDTYQKQAKRLQEIVSILRAADTEIPSGIVIELRELLDFVASTQEYHGELWH